MASTATMFNTYEFAQRLKGAGFTEPQVDAMTTGLNDIAIAKVATKDDLRDVENRLTIKIGAIGATLLGLGVALVKLT